MSNWFQFCCQAGNCVIAEDDFNRADSTALGSLWDERSGDWEIFGNELKENGNAGALVVCTTESPGSPFDAFVSIDLRDDIADGAKPRIIVNYLDDDNYFFAELTISMPDSSTLRLWRRAGGTNTALTAPVTLVGLTLNSLSACFIDESFAAHVTAAPQEWLWVCHPATHANGRKAGIGNGGNVAFTCDTFLFLRHLIRSPSGFVCPSCQCTCDLDTGKKHCLPWTLTLTISTNDTCSVPDGTTVTLTYDWAAEVWSGSKFLCGETWLFNFYCLPSGSCAEEELVLGWTPATLCVGGGCELPTGASTCNPLSLVYGPFEICYDELVGRLCPCCDPDTCDDLTFTITE